MADTKREIVEALLAAHDEGREPDLEALAARFPGRQSEIERIGRAVEAYERGMPEVEASCDVVPGDRFGDFVVERLIGAGGMGQVFLARQQSLGQRQVALKVLPGALRSESNLKRFEREATLLAELHHPGLAEVYGFGEERGTQYIAMRFVEGRTLQEALKDIASGRIQPSERELQRGVLHWALEIAEALAVVHTAGLVHRDVKPSNILLEQEGGGRGPLSGSAVLVDFGLVRAVDSTEHTLTGHGAATPAYASPEQLLGLEANPSSDVFSLGVTLHDLLARRMPADRDPAGAGLAPISELCPDIDPDLAAVIGKMLERESDWRYADATQLLADLRQLEVGGMVSARFPPVHERLKRWVQRDPGRILRGGVGLLGFAAALSLGLFLLVTFREARELGAAWRSGDALALTRGAESLGYPGQWFIGDEQARAAFEQLRDPTRDGPVRRIAAALRDRDAITALREGATPLRRDGLESEPFLARFLLSSLAEEVRGADSDEPGGVEALGMVARLFFERPVETREERVASEPFRRALLERWSRTDRPLHERLLILSAFSGLGRVEDLDWILRWSLEQEMLSEQARLASAVSERILRRAIVLDDVEGFDHGALHRLVLEAVTPPYRELFGPAWGHARTRGIGMHAADLARALGLFRRHAGLPASLDSVLPSWEDDPKLESRFWLVTLRAVNRDEQAIAALEEGRYLWGLVPRAFESWGRLCGLVGDALDTEALWASAQERVRELDADLASDCLAQLEVGIAMSAGFESGQAEQLDPDRNTRLGANPESPAWVDVPMQSGPLPESSPEASTHTIAHWKVEHGTTTARGPIDSLRGKLTELAINERRVGYLLMYQPGLSELEVRFTVEDGVGPADWTLVVHCQVGARGYLPYRGEASFDLHLDGKLFDAGRLLFVRDPENYVVELPGELIPPGEHTLTLHLNPRTNTTFRVYALGIEAPR